MKKLIFLFPVLIMVFISSSCNKEEKSTYLINIRMTDDPGPYEAVMIDLQEVKVTGSDDVEVSLDAVPGIYNLLDLTNGVDVLIATGSIDSDSLQQIRLILGPDNTITVDGETFSLDTPSAEQSGLKLQVHEALEAGVEYEILLDFDANKSILRTGNGKYKLKPVIRTIYTAKTGSIKGAVTPEGTVASVEAESDGETYSSYVAVDGRFMIKGLPAGTYTLSVTPEEPLVPVTLNDIVVEIGAAADVGTIDLE